MSDDPTKDIGEKYETKPTIETVVEMIAALRDHMDRRFDALESGTNARFDGLEGRLKKVEHKITVLNEDMLELRADVRELKDALKMNEPR